MFHRSLALSLAVLLTAFAPACLRAQAGGEGTVTGHGSVEIRRRPESLRVQVEILAKGKDLKEALTRLKERRTAAEGKLESVGAVKEFVEFGEPVITTDKNDRQQQMEMMVRQKLRGQRKKPDAKAAPASVVVGMSLKADLPLKADPGQDLLLAANALQEKVKAADLGGTKELKQLSPQEEELAEELQGGDLGSPEEMGPQRGEPAFFFVSRISDEERAKAMAEAFQKAKREAARLARAAGADLGSLRRLDNASQVANDPDESGSSRYNPYYYQMQQRLQAAQAGADEQTAEAVGIQPGKVALRVMVTASFSLAPSSGK